MNWKLLEELINSVLLHLHLKTKLLNTITSVKKKINWKCGNTRSYNTCIFKKDLIWSVAIAYEDPWCLGCILRRIIKNIKWAFSSKGSSSLILLHTTKGCTKCIMTVEPLTAIGRVYTLMKEEIKLSSVTSEKYQKFK